MHPTARPDPASVDPLVAGELARSVPDAAGLHLGPAGGERHGLLAITCLPARAVARDPGRAVVALWKLQLCLEEEWTYEAWPRETVTSVVERWHRSESARRLRGRPERALLRDLASAAHDTFEAQRSMERPTNLPTYHPDRATVEALGLASLDFLSEDASRRVVADAWNHRSQLFEHGGRYYLVDWSTSA